MPTIYETSGHWEEIRDYMRSDLPVERAGAAEGIERTIERLANGSYLSNDDAKAAFRTLINDAMASPEDQPHALFNEDNWKRCDLSGVASFRWTTGGGTKLDLVMRYTSDDDIHGEDEYDFSLEHVPGGDEDD